MIPSFSETHRNSDRYDKENRVTALGEISQNFGWIVGWFAIALALRLMNLAAKPAWMDEVATTLFSLGNYSRLIPLNEIISLEQILRPLQITPGTTAQDVVKHLLTEDNHPPIYFVLAHGWMAFFHRFFGNGDGYASLWAARALPAFFGALTVPATYILAWVSFRDRLICQLCAILMAFSPFGVFMAQEARHYSLAILAVIASLICFVLAVKSVAQGKPMPWPIVFAWVVINTLGLSTHFFCGLTWIAEGMTLLWLWVKLSANQWRHRKATHQNFWRQATWLRIYAAATGTLAGTLIWLPIWLNFYGSPQTSYLKSGGGGWQRWVNPIVQSLASWFYAILSPDTRGYSGVAIALIVISCVLLLLCYAPWLVSVLQRSLRFQLRQPTLQSGIQALGGFFISANALFLLICYGSGFDITRGHRYSFVFFPSIILLVGVSLAPFWQAKASANLSSEPLEQTESPSITPEPIEPEPAKSQPVAHIQPDFSQVKLPIISKFISGRAFVATVIAICFLGAQMIVNDLSNLKFYSADRLVSLIQAQSTLPVVIGTETTITEQPSVVGIEMMSIAWEIQRNFNPQKSLVALEGVSQGKPQPNQTWPGPLQFLIAENNEAKGLTAEPQIIKSLQTLPNAFDLWLIGMSPDLESTGCKMLTDGGQNKGSFNYTHYVCR
jgi:uncharacterized membrane protein